MSNSVYLVSDGKYSDYKVIAVFSTKELAEDCKRTFDCENEITCFELDPPFVVAPDGYHIFSVALDYESHNVYYVTSGLWWSTNIQKPLNEIEILPTRKGLNYIRIVLLAENEEHAVKIANEKLSQYKIDHPFFDSQTKSGGGDYNKNP